MAQNFNRDKRRIEETKRKRREEKKNRKLNRAAEGAAPASVPAPAFPDTPPPPESQA
jgi:hypothetical protein